MKHRSGRSKPCLVRLVIRLVLANFSSYFLILSNFHVGLSDNILYPQTWWFINGYDMIFRNSAIVSHFLGQTQIILMHTILHTSTYQYIMYHIYNINVCVCIFHQISTQTSWCFSSFFQVKPPFFPWPLVDASDPSSSTPHRTGAPRQWLNYSLWMFMVDITIVNVVYKLTYNWGCPTCMF